MGHVTDKIELIILGGTWSDYPEEYQLWFVSELFRALNDGDREEQSQIRRTYYKGQGLANRDEELEAFVAPLQKQVDMGSCSYNVAIKQLYYYDSIWKDIAFQEVADTTELNRLQNDNETAEHRVVGLVVETRPDTISCESLKLLRQLGCTKIQMGIQSINPEILAKNNRNISLERIQQAFELVRVFGFKIHTHTMLNLFGSTPEEDKREYARFVTEEAFQPDEIKLYPCALVQGTRLCKHFEDGSWEPYTEEELLDVLIADTLNTPAFVRISRMIRDISAEDIVTGNKKANLRQLVERRIEETGGQIAEIRQREISTGVVDFERLSLSSIAYKTTVTDEFFLQWTTPENRIAGFLRLSLPYEEYLLQYRADIPLGLSEAMIREVHVYGKVAKLQNVGEGAQHLGLGKLLIEEACTLARARGYQKINVISSVGTREYYRSLGFSDTELYQQKTLV
jgi:elongator complex protein 3